jgi:hypothetical protein
MNQKQHPALVGLAIALTLAAIVLLWMRVSDSAEGRGIPPPPALQKLYKEKGKAIFPTTVPGKYGGTLGIPTQNAKPAGH